MIRNLRKINIVLLTTIIFICTSCNKKNTAQKGQTPEKTEENIAEKTSRENTFYKNEFKNVIYLWVDSVPLNQYFPEDKVNAGLNREFRTFYRKMNYLPAFVNREGMNEHGKELISILKDSRKEGLRPGDYYLEEIRSTEQPTVKETPTIEELTKLDFLLTSAFMKYASHISMGRIDPKVNKTTWVTYPRTFNLSEILYDGINEKGFEEIIEKIRPQNKQYNLLKEKLVKYYKIKEEGGWKPVPENIPLKKGDTSKNIKILKERLEKIGYISPTELRGENAYIFNETLEEAVKNIQNSFGLRVDGVPGKSTIAQLNVPVEERIDQIMINLERMRWVPKNIEKKYLQVNIPEYVLRVFENGEIKLKMKVIVGKEFNSTPIFIDTVEHVVFSPTWNVPMSIARDEMLPKIKRDPSYLYRNHYTLYDRWTQNAVEINPFLIKWDTITSENFNFRIVQNPGRHNALGLVKFMFPNKYSIYLHDTPSDHLFNEEQRSFSHGCIRVEKPTDLAIYLLNDSEWDRETVKEYMTKEKPVTVLLPEKIPVEILYYTAFLNEDNILNFRQDIYGHDKSQINQIYQIGNL